MSLHFLIAHPQTTNAGYKTNATFLTKLYKIGKIQNTKSKPKSSYLRRNYE